VCFVRVAAVISAEALLPDHRRPTPLAKLGASIEVTFSTMSPPDCPLVLGGCGPVANMWIVRSCSSRSTIGLVWLLDTVPNVVLLHVAPVERMSSEISGREPDDSLVFTAA